MSGTYTVKLMGGTVHDGLEIAWPANVLLPLVLLVNRENGRVLPVHDEFPTKEEAEAAGWDVYKLTRDQEINGGWPGAGAFVMLHHQPFVPPAPPPEAPAQDTAAAVPTATETPRTDQAVELEAPPKVDVAPEVLEQLKATAPVGSEGDAPPAEVSQEEAPSV